MAWIARQSCRFLLPEFTDEVMEGQSFERFEALSDVIGDEEGVGGLLQVLGVWSSSCLTVASFRVRLMRSTWPKEAGHGV